MEGLGRDLTGTTSGDENVLPCSRCHPHVMGELYKLGVKLLLRAKVKLKMKVMKKMKMGISGGMSTG